MNNLFQENKKSFLLLLGLLFILIIVAYFLFYQPMTKELQKQENQKTQLESDIATYHAQLNNADNVASLNKDIEIMKLAKFMPSTPELENFLMTIGEIELLSGSRIYDITFSYDGTLPERTVEEEGTADTESAETAEEDTSDEASAVADAEPKADAVEVETPPVIEMIEKPENLRLITASMNVASPDYEHYQQFIQEIEKQERIMMVNRIEFEKPAESELMLGEDVDESIVSTIDVTTFYYDETGANGQSSIAE
ncbi:hypothetical protein [Oceanobacillus chungangensis]|uniref:Pilus assembly protein PilO n=1 Tax=Oceanobacillus chungangensis TaxID=1229152 RepID=A0A3D8Q2B0_9BACI|nr:hypothetical protein [Oceanobacillus chungangensis]RDW21569.1 hypothetical protein CWR45_01460 [Oceanobacillus chungangensis]